METGWLDTAIDAKVLATLGGHPALLAALVWPGGPVVVTATAAVVVLACVLRRRYGEAAFVAVSVPLAAAITELVLKPLIGRTSWGDPFPSGHVTSVAALATALTVLLARTPTRVPAPAASCPCLHGIPDSGRRRPRGDRREYASLQRHCRGSRRRHWDGPSDRTRPRHISARSGGVIMTGRCPLPWPRSPTPARRSLATVTVTPTSGGCRPSRRRADHAPVPSARADLPGQLGAFSVHVPC